MFIYAAPEDFTAIEQDFTFPANEISICWTVNSTNDVILEDDKDFMLTLTTSDDRVNLSLSEATITILNDDSRWNLIRNGHE